MTKYSVSVTTTYYVYAKDQEQAREIVETAEEKQGFEKITIADQAWEIEEL